MSHKAPRGTATGLGRAALPRLCLDSGSACGSSAQSLTRHLSNGGGRAGGPEPLELLARTALA